MSSDGRQNLLGTLASPIPELNTGIFNCVPLDEVLRCLLR